MGVNVPEHLRYQRGFVAFDSESMLIKGRRESYAPQTFPSIGEEHVPVSIALAHSQDIAGTTVYLVAEDDDGTAELVRKFVDELRKLHKYHYNKQLERYLPYLQQLEQAVWRIEDAEDGIVRDNTEQLLAPSPYHDYEEVKRLCGQPPRRTTALRRLYWQFYAFVFKMPIIGYNSSQYDLNTLRAYLFPLLAPDKPSDVQLLKRRSRYLSVEKNEFKFLDAYLFMAAGTSLDAFMKSQLGAHAPGKLEFPYLYLNSTARLGERALPPAAHWLKVIRGRYDSATPDERQTMMREAEERRAKAQRYWDEHDLQTFGDYLRAYNIADVQPFISAFENFAELFRKKQLDIFSYLTLPSVAKQYGLLMSKPGCNFNYLDGALYEKIRKSVCGGINFLWCRMVECGKTKIRPYEYGTAARTAKSIIGMDMSGCYLHASAQEHMTGPCFVRDAASQYCITDNIKNLNSILAIEYEAMARFGAEGLEKLQHQCKGGEKIFLTDRGTQYRVDGYVELANGEKHIIEYNGCYWHNHSPCPRGANRNLNLSHNPQKEQKRLEYLPKQVTSVIVIPECKWLKARKTPECERFIETRPMNETYLTRNRMTQAQVLSRITAGKLKGLVEIDAYVPHALRCGIFKDINPFFYNKEVCWDDIGQTMQNILRDLGREFTGRKMLLNPPFCEKLLLPHQYIKWLMEKGIEIVKVHSVIEFPYASNVYEPLAREITERRQAAAGDAAREAEGLQQKLIGNALYGISITNVEDFTRTLLMTAKRASQLLFQKRVKNCEYINEDCFELTTLPGVQTIRQTPQFGAVVYALSKLRVLMFAIEWFELLQRDKFQLILCDTDSLYVCFAEDRWQDCVRAGVTTAQVEAFERKWFALVPAQSKTPGLWHCEFSGTLLIAPSPKLYVAEKDGQRKKVASRGINAKHNALTTEMFRKQLYENSVARSRVRGQQFRLVDSRMVTWKYFPNSFTATYIKHKVMPDMCNTEQLDWKYPPWATLAAPPLPP